MKNVLVIEDLSSVRKLFENLLNIYSLDNQYKLFFATSYEDTKNILEKENIDIAFVDIALKNDAFEGINVIRFLREKNIPEIYIISGFDAGYLSQIVKKDIHQCVRGFIKKDENFYQNVLKVLQEEQPEEGFFDFDFMDFDNEREAQEIHSLNETHIKLSVEDYLASLTNKEKIINTATTVENTIREIENIDETNFEDHKDLIISALEDFQLLVYSNDIFEPIFDSADQVIDIVENIDYEALPEDIKQKFVMYLQGILFEIDDWIKNVFIDKTAQDISYINASLKNSVYMLKKLVEEEIG